MIKRNPKKGAKNLKPYHGNIRVRHKSQKTVDANNQLRAENKISHLSFAILVLILIIVLGLLFILQNDYAAQKANSQAPSFIEFCSTSIMCIGLSIATMLFLFGAISYFYFFVGIYLYKNLIDLALQTKKKEIVSKKNVIEKPKTNLLEIIIRKIGIGKERKKAKFKKSEEISEKVNKIFEVLIEAKKAIAKNDLAKIEKLYVKGRNLYIDLAHKEKKEIYDNLLELYNKRNQLVKRKWKRKKDFKKFKWLETVQRREDWAIEKLEREKAKDSIREKIRQFFHKMGLYKTPEEKRQIELQKEKKRREKLIIQEELKRLKDLEENKIKEEKRKKQLEQEKIRQKELKKQEMLRKQEEQKKRAEEKLRKQKELESIQRKQLIKEKIRGFLHKIGLYETPEEKQKRLIREEEIRKKKQLEKARAEEYKKKLAEALRQQIEFEKSKQQIDISKKLALQKEHERLWLKQKKLEEKQKEKERKKQEIELKKQRKEAAGSTKDAEKKIAKGQHLEEEIKQNLVPRPEIEEKKLGWFKRLFKKEKEEPELKKFEEEHEKKPSSERKLFGKLTEKTEKEEPKAKQELDEFEELEQSIKELGLFKKLEKVPLEAKEVIKEHAREQTIAKIKQKIFGIFGKKADEAGTKEMQSKVLERIISRDKKLEEFYRIISDVKVSIAKNDMAKAKEFYIEARNNYLKLNEEEKKEVYDELTELYNKIK